MGQDYRNNKRNNQRVYHQPRNAPSGSSGGAKTKKYLSIGQTIYFHATIHPEKQDGKSSGAYVKCKGNILRQPNDPSNPIYKVIVSDICLLNSGATDKETKEARSLIGKKFLRKDEQLFLSAPEWWSGGADWSGGNVQKISEAINRFKNKR